MALSHVSNIKCGQYIVNMCFWYLQCIFKKKLFIIICVFASVMNIPFQPEQIENLFSSTTQKFACRSAVSKVTVHNYFWLILQIKVTANTVYCRRNTNNNPLQKSRKTRSILSSAFFWASENNVYLI